MGRQRNDGLRKICGCRKAEWPRCPHSWHLNFKFKGEHFRFSLDKELGRHVDSKSEARGEADRLRGQIRSRAFRQPQVMVRPDSAQLGFRSFADVWKARRGCELANAKDNGYRLGT